MQQIMIIGHLGSDPEMRYTQTGVAVANFNVAHTEKWKDKSGQKQEKTTWFRVAVWREQATNVAEYLHKGSQVCVMGKMEAPSVWIDKEGIAQSRLEVTAERVHFLSSGNRQESASAPAHRNQNGPSNDAPTDDDIPF